MLRTHALYDMYVTLLAPSEDCRYLVKLTKL